MCELNKSDNSLIKVTQKQIQESLVSFSEGRFNDELILGESDEYARLMDLAVVERESIQAELPWPEVLVNLAAEVPVDESP